MRFLFVAALLTANAAHAQDPGNMSCVVEPRLSKKQVRRVREWVSAPRYPFNVVVFTGSPVAGLSHGGGR